MVSEPVQIESELSLLEELSRPCLELLASPDLEWMQERLLVELSGLSDAQSAALWLADEQGELQLKAYRGVIDRRNLAERFECNEAFRAAILAGASWTSQSDTVMFVPLVAAGEILGLAQLLDPLPGFFGEVALRSTAVLGSFAAVGVRTGKRLASLQRLGLRDRDTAAYTLSYFTDYASKEIYKARRYGRTFSLLTFSVDNLVPLKLRLGPAEAHVAMRGVIRALSSMVRDSDVIAKATEQELYLLLPETDFFGSTMFLQRAIAAVREDEDVRAIEERLPLAVVGGAATYPKDGEDFDELIHHCRRRMNERRYSLQRKLMLDAVPFWDEVELLLGGAQSPRLPSDERAEPSRRGKVAQVLFDEVQVEISRELNRDPLSRGLLYVGGPEVRSDLPIAMGLTNLSADFAFRVYLLGRRADLDSHPALTPVFLEGDERLGRHEFLLWLSEHAAYALIQRRGKGAIWGFHTSDPALVEGLISKLQTEYDLQPY